MFDSVGQVYPRSLDFDVVSALVQLVSAPSNLATTIRLEEALGQPLRGRAAPPAAAPEVPRNAPEDLGAYSREAVAWLEGRYLTLRPSFGAPDAIFAYRTEIAWDAASARLGFREAERLDTPFTQSGHVAVPNQSGMIYLVTNWHGQCRLAVLCRPPIQGEMFGVLTTLHAGRGTQLTPAAAPLALIPEGGALATGGFGRITPDLPAYPAYRRHLGRVSTDAFATFFGCPPCPAPSRPIGPSKADRGRSTRPRRSPAERCTVHPSAKRRIG